MNEPTQNDILSAINKLAQQNEQLALKTDKIAQQNEQLALKTDKLAQQNEDILSTINTFAQHTEERFTGIEKRLNGVESRLTTVETTMVTKDYLDEKLGDLRGDFTVLMRKEDRKLNVLVEELVKYKVLPMESAQHILNMEPFPRA